MRGGIREKWTRSNGNRSWQDEIYTTRKKETRVAIVLLPLLPFTQAFLIWKRWRLCMSFYGLGPVEKTFNICPLQETTFRLVIVNIQWNNLWKLWTNFFLILCFPQTRLRRNSLGSVLKRIPVNCKQNFYTLNQFYALETRTNKYLAVQRTLLWMRHIQNTCDVSTKWKKMCCII